MRKIDQTIFCNVRGNCYAAIIASLLELELDQVPNFVEEENWTQVLVDFMLKHGYEFVWDEANGNRRGEDKSNYPWFGKELYPALSIGGYYDAVVYSPKFFDKEKYDNDPNYKPSLHAVIIDSNFNIVHDPNPNYKGIEKYPMADEIGYNGVIEVRLWKKIIKKAFTIEAV